MTLRSSEPMLRESASLNKQGSNYEYVLPRSVKNLSSSIIHLNSSLDAMRPLAKSCDPDISLVFGILRRKLRFFFLTAYEYDSDEDIDYYSVDVISDISKDLDWFREDSLTGQTITLEKGETDLCLCYEQGFNATDETLRISMDNKDTDKQFSLEACAKGIRSEHTSAGLFEYWRNRPSSFSMSLRKVDEGLEIGIENNSPQEPLWWRALDAVRTYGSPYWCATFDLDNQTRQAKNMYEYRYK